MTTDKHGRKKMKTITISLAALVMLAGGCDWMTSRLADPSVDAWTITSANDQAVRDALVRQSTMYPYHFVTGGAHLNTLGASDLATLIGHFQTYPGRLSIRRGNAAKPLYDARVAEVLAALATGGIDVDRIAVVDLPAAG